MARLITDDVDCHHSIAKLPPSSDRGAAPSTSDPFPNNDDCTADSDASSSANTGADVSTHNHADCSTNSGPNTDADPGSNSGPY